MRIVELRDIAEISAGQAAPKDIEMGNNGFPFIRAGHLSGLIAFNNIDSLLKVKEDLAKVKKLKLLPSNTILFAKSGMSASLDRVYRLSEEAYFVSHLAALIPKEKVDPVYLQYYITWYKPSRLISDPAYPSIKLSDISKISVPLPPLSEQKRIASILDKADALRKKNKELLDTYDELLKATFLDMFGDPVTNPKGWEISKVSEFAESRLGKMLDKKRINGNNLKPYLRNSNVQWLEFKFDDLLEMDFDEKDQVEFKLQYGDVLMCEGGEIGRCAVWKNEKEDIYFQKAIHRIRFNTELMLPDYFVWMFRQYTINGGLNKFLGAATILHLTGVNLKKITLPVPPISLQNQFVQIVENIESQKALAKQSLQESEDLFNALVQKAFKGELSE